MSSNTVMRNVEQVGELFSQHVLINSLISVSNKNIAIAMLN